MINKNKSKKIFLLYGILFLGFLIFLAVMLLTVVKSRHLPSMVIKKSSKSERGSIVSADGFHIATTQKLYKAIVNTYYIDPKKEDLFIQLFSIYSNIDAKEVRKKLHKKKGVVVLSYHVHEKQAQYLKKLSYELRRYKVFIERVNPRTGLRTLHGLSIIESGESREYPYGNLLTPIVGYSHKIEDDGYTRIKGVKGVEKRFDEELSAEQDGYSMGKRDVNSYIILNKDSYTKPNIGGYDVKLTIPVALQIKMERMLDKMKREVRAKQIMLTIMDTKTGKLLTVATSNRFFPKAIKRKDYPSLNAGVIEYSFEPGSVIKPIVFSMLLDKGLVNPYDMINGHNGKYKLGRKVITDEHKFDWISAENVIVHSSNIGMAILSQRLSASEYHLGLKNYGFTSQSTPDLIYEKRGSIPSLKRLKRDIYKATCSYGYGMQANLMQLIKAYSAFNNNGRIVTPRLVSSFIDEQNQEILMQEIEQPQAIKSSTALRMKDILIKTVNHGTGKKAITYGLIVGGKTGTAHIVEKKRYVRKYNTSFIGFVNDKKHKYTMGVVVIQPKKSQFASQTAVPVFKRAIDILIEDNYLTPLKPKVIK